MLKKTIAAAFTMLICSTTLTHGQQAISNKPIESSAVAQCMNYEELAPDDLIGESGDPTHDYCWESRTEFKCSSGKALVRTCEECLSGTHCTPWRNVGSC